MDEWEKNLLEEVGSADQDRLSKYVQMLDRVLLYNIAANVMPEEALDGIVDLWDKIIFKTIDSDVASRNEFLESTPLGRLARYKKEPDGEALRLHCIKNWKIARKVALSNLKGKSQESDSDETEE